MERGYINETRGRSILAEEAAYTHCKPRLDDAISNRDKSGITKAANWQGGGGYHFYELAPTLINEDAFEEAIINPG